MSATGFLLILLAAALTCVGNLLLRAGIGDAGGFAPAGPVDAVLQFARLLLHPRFAAGFLTYFASALVWFRVVASEALSIAYPVMVSITFVMVTVGAVLLFNERFTLRLGLGMALIALGIAVLATQGSSA